MTIDVGFSGILVFLLVFVRLAGMILLNPLLNRSNVPMMARMGLVFFLTILIAPLQSAAVVTAMGDLEYIFAVIRELFIGAIYGYAFSVFYFMLYFAGDTMDTDFGIAMAKTFDPATQIQVSFSGQLLNIIFGLYIFATNSHLALIRMYTDSFALIPLGGATFSVDILTFAVRLVSSVFMLALRLVAPFMVAEFALQITMGILMKFVSQISIFVINFQMRIVLGLLLLFLFAPFIGQFIDTYITVMFDNLADATAILAAGTSA